MSLSTILVPLDGSRFAESAVPLAVRLARCAKAQLHLVLVHESRTALVRAATVPGPVGLEDPDVRAHGEEYLAMTAGELHALGVPVVTHTLLDGYAGPALAHEIEEQKPALVVMASRGRRRSSSRRFGRVADYVARNTTAPVLLHRPRDAQFTSSREPHWRRILVPLDPLREWEAMLPSLIQLAIWTQAHVRLLHVSERTMDVAEEIPYRARMVTKDPASLEADALIALDRIADRLRARGVSVSARAIVGSDVARTILQQIDRERVDCVALGRPRAGGMGGRIAGKVIRDAAKPVLILGHAVELLPSRSLNIAFIASRRYP